MTPEELQKHAPALFRSMALGFIRDHCEKELRGMGGMEVVKCCAECNYSDNKGQPENWSRLCRGCSRNTSGDDNFEPNDTTPTGDKS